MSARKKKATRPDEIAAEKLERLDRAEPGVAGELVHEPPRGLPGRVRRLLIGGPRDLLDPRVFHHIRLIAFLAWVGLGADGLSSSCYGPEEAFKALGTFHHLALYLVFAVVLTVLVISSSYSRIIEQFPTGGGGYLVASKLLGPWSGLVSGSALVVDYSLTVAISIASGADQVFSMLDPERAPWKPAVVVSAIALMVVMNLRGVKESVTILTPIFLLFLVTHAFLIGYGIFTHLAGLPTVVADAVRETSASVGSMGFVATGLLLLKAYSLGGGTFTGIEAVSNGLPILAEPRVETAKRTMKYMAFSLAFTAGGILFCYMLLGVGESPGKTLNAVLFDELLRDWGTPGTILVWTSLIAEAALLFVAAQAGFVDGPRILASMAVDSWMPHRFAMLSDRLVTRNGVLVMGSSALAFIALTGAKVSHLVVLYSINVFLTFTLSQLGMVRLYLSERATMPQFRRRIAVMATGLVMTSAILVATVSLKFREGGWMTILITGALVAFCTLVKRHYNRVRLFIGELDKTLLQLPPKVHVEEPLAGDPRAPTAAILVSGYNGLGIHTLYTIIRLFPSHYRNFVFMSVAVVDSERFKGRDEVDSLREATDQALQRYVAFANHLGLHGESRMGFGIDATAEVELLARHVTESYPRSVFFAGRLVFPEESMFTRMLHNETGLAIQRRLHLAGIPMVILPIRAS